MNLKELKEQTDSYNKECFGVLCYDCPDFPRCDICNRILTAQITN